MPQQSKRMPGKITRRENVEFGLVAILVVLFMALRAGRIHDAHYLSGHYLLAAFVLTLLTIIVPRIFYPFAAAWFGLSGILGRVSSAVLMTLVFFGIVLPAGLVRKWRGVDPLKIKAFKKGEGSVLSPRNHIYKKEDLLKTF